MAAHRFDVNIYNELYNNHSSFLWVNVAFQLIQIQQNPLRLNEHTTECNYITAKYRKIRLLHARKTNTPRTRDGNLECDQKLSGCQYASSYIAKPSTQLLHIQVYQNTQGRATIEQWIISDMRQNVEQRTSPRILVITSTICTNCVFTREFVSAVILSMCVLLCGMMHDVCELWTKTSWFIHARNTYTWHTCRLPLYTTC